MDGGRREHVEVPAVRAVPNLLRHEGVLVGALRPAPPPDPGPVLERAILKSISMVIPFKYLLWVSLESSTWKLITSPPSLKRQAGLGGKVERSERGRNLRALFL